MSTLAAVLDGLARTTVLGRMATWTVLATLVVAAVSYGLATFSTRFGGRTALNFFVWLFVLDGVGVALLLAGTAADPFTRVGLLVAAQAVLVVLPFVLGGVLLDLAPAAAVVGAIPIAILVAFLATFDLGLLEFGRGARVAVAGLLAVVGPTVVSAASTTTRGVLD